MQCYEAITVRKDRHPGQDAPVKIVRVADCGGRRWAVTPATRTVYYLATLSPADVAQAIIEAAAALPEHDARPQLRLVRTVPELSAG